MGGFGGAALAQSPEEQIVASLAEQGFDVVMRDRTWLGRIWLVVENGEIRREIVFNPGTGEILRDYAVMLALADDGTAGSGSTRKPSVGAVVAGSETVEQSAVVVPSQTLGDPLLVLPAMGE